MKFAEVIKFKSPTEIDWKATEKAIIDRIKKEYPDDRPSSLAMLSSNRTAIVKRFVKKLGVEKVYQLHLEYEQEKKREKK